jgi:hypothetical protein
MTTDDIHFGPKAPGVKGTYTDSLGRTGTALQFGPVTAVIDPTIGQYLDGMMSPRRGQLQQDHPKINMSSEVRSYSRMWPMASMQRAEPDRARSLWSRNSGITGNVWPAVGI